MNTDVAIYRSASLEARAAYLQTLADAGTLIPRGLWAEQVIDGKTVFRPSVAKITFVAEAGLMIGLSPLASIRGIDVIDDALTLKPSLMSALIRDAGHTLRIRKSGTLEDGDLAVRTIGIRKDDPEFEFESTWTPHDAVRAGLLDEYAPDAAGTWRAVKLTNGNEIPIWQAYTARMCQWRSLGDVGTLGFEDVLMGLHLTPEEMGGRVNDAGELLQVVEPEPAPVEDWIGMLDAATDAAEVRDIQARARAAKQYGDDVRTKALTKFGVFTRKATVDAEAKADARRDAGLPVIPCPNCGEPEAHWEPAVLGAPGSYACGETSGP